jgi:Arc/MetJ-type ribon-helix-helix transcriptional regulator
MPTITLSVPEDMKTEMDKSREINWSEVARVAIRLKLEQLKILKAIASKSTLTEKDALELGRKINKSLHEKYSQK